MARRQTSQLSAELGRQQPRLTLICARPDGDALQLSAPGMPAGSPGMESPAARPYDVVTFDKTGKLKVFSTQTPMAPVR